MFCDLRGASYLWKRIVICESVCISGIVFDLCKCFVTRASVFHPSNCFFPSECFPSEQVFCDLRKCFVICGSVL